MSTMADDSASRDAVVIERSFDAPVDLVWRMWTEPEHFRAWYGPDGVTIPVAKMDVRPGGSRLVCMEMDRPGGPVRMWFTGEYREVVRNQRLVYTESMCDEDGTALPSPGPGEPGGLSEPAEVIVELEDLGGRTRMVLTHVGVAPGSPGAAGWTMALGKLAAYCVPAR
jgi:uncharacterized protein YndB with AHSA1/START domain